MLILVNGLMTYNSGKTLFARALAQEMVHRGFQLGVFKPQSAHNYWDHLSHSKRCGEMGKLVSRDALELREASGDHSPIEVINPHHQLFCPLDVLKVWEARPGARPTGDDELLAERMTLPAPEGALSTLYVNRDSKLFIAEEDFLSALARGVHATKGLNSLASKDRGAAAQEAITSCFGAQRGTHRQLLVESTNDVALPPSVDPSEVTLVVTMAANLVLCFPGRAFFRSAQVTKAIRVRDFLGLAEPVLGYRLPYVPEDERGDADRVYAHFGSAAAGVIDEAIKRSGEGH